MEKGVRNIMNMLENCLKDNENQVFSIDPDLDRLYRESAIAIAVSGQTAGLDSTQEKEEPRSHENGPESIVLPFQIHP